jgi:RNA polymerase sigma-32 factor
MPDGQMMQPTTPRGRNVLLTAEQESDLLLRWRESSDQQALDRLLRAFEPLCRKLAKRYEGAAERNDLLQEARLGLLDAIRRFDPQHGTRLATYASFWIHERLRRYTTETQPIVRVPRNTRQWLSKMLEEAGRADPTGQAGDGQAIARAVAERHGIDESVALMAQQMLGAGNVVSLDAPLAGEDRDRPQSRLDQLHDPAPSPEHQVAEAHDTDVHYGLLMQAITTLPDRKAEIIRARHLAETPMTLEALARRFGVSKERVRQLETAAMRDLRKAIHRGAGERV